MPRITSISRGELCYSCHQKKAEDFAKGKVHPLVKAGKCLVCHDPHASTYKAHLRNSPEQLCFDCHNQRDEGFITTCQTHSQYPVSKSDCLICHSAHAVYVHEPFVKNRCDSCHVSSDSPEPFKLKLTYTELCYSCHKDMLTEVSNQEDAHLPVKEGRCANCHASHAAENEHLLVVAEEKLCVNNCHHDVTEKLKSKYPHSPAEPIPCLKCHKPHDSENESLLVDDSTAMCISCHKREKKFTHPLGEAAIDPRTNKGMTCVTCHDAHGSEYEFVLLADRQRDLCIQCHKR
ncbi:MAG: cytochrome c3 family protein [Candidatus Poribacteria bacterium]